MSEVSAETLRTQRGLRVVTADENGSDVFHMPNGVFGFTYSPAQREMPIYDRKPMHSFEVQRLNDGSVHMVGFVTPETRDKIQAKAGMVQAVLYPDPYQAATALVSLDVEDMQPAKKAITREDGNPLKTLVYPE